MQEWIYPADLALSSSRSRMLPPQRATSRCRNHNSEGEHYVKLQTFFLVTSALLGKHLLLTFPFLHMCLITPLPFSAPAGKISVPCNHLNQLNQKKKNSHGIKTQNVFVPVFLFKDLSGAFFFFALQAGVTQGLFV